MPPDERRAAIIAATLPLLREHGPQVSTRDIARAAGIAEGTIFGVFPDKQSLIQAALASAFDPEPVIRALSAIDPTDTLRNRLRDAAAILSRRFTDNVVLIGMLRAGMHPSADPSDFMRSLEDARCRLGGALTELIEPDRDQLRRSPQTVAHLLHMLTMTATRGRFATDEELSSDEIVSLLLDGLLKHPPTTGEPA
jgi:AcrR family transcriptional regulator